MYSGAINILINLLRHEQCAYVCVCGVTSQIYAYFKHAYRQYTLPVTQYIDVHKICNRTICVSASITSSFFFLHRSLSLIPKHICEYQFSFLPFNTLLFLRFLRQIFLRFWSIDHKPFVLCVTKCAQNAHLFIEMVSIRER